MSILYLAALAGAINPLFPRSLGRRIRPSTPSGSIADKMEPPDTTFDSTHELFDSQGNAVQQSPAASTGRSFGHSFGEKHKGFVHSVFLAEGLHLSIDPDELDELPRRFEAGSSKAKLTWFGALCLAGIGMFLEAYIIITTGQIKTIWHAAAPACFEPDATMDCPNNIGCCGLFPNTPDTCGASDLCDEDGTYPDTVLCNEGLIGGISYSEFAGIMLGMLTFGKVADVMGRHFAGLLTALFQVVGVTLMTFFRHDNANTQLLVFVVFFGIFGFGVGGEYPLTAAGAAAHHVESMEEAEKDDEERHRIRVLREKERTVRRGETISMVFAMQGVGAVTGSVFLLCLIYFGGQSHVDCNGSGHNPAGVSAESLDAIWRTFYFIGGVFVMMVLAYRGLILEEGGGHKKLLSRKERRKAKLGDGSSIWKILKFYGPRLIATGGNWFLVDIAFYGMKLFSGPILGAINPSGDLATQNGFLLVSNLCGLVGYYCTAFVIDRPLIGRKRLQMYSLLVCALLFFVTGGVFYSASPGALLFLFFLSSFFIQFGPNVTAYVMAAETYPTELRGTCHGLSAFMGKSGALLATIVFSHLSSQQIFYICGATSLLGALFTLLFSVDLTRVSLAEHDAQLELFLEGRLDDYKGKLNAPRHLSLYEKWTGRHGEYDPKWAFELAKKDMLRALLSEESTE